MNLKFRAWDEQFQSMSEVIDIDYRRECIELSHFDGDEYPIIQDFNLTARNSPTSKVAGCKGFGLVQ